MANQEVVSCPGCGKRYSVPPDVPPGQFQCQDCSAVVAYGAAPAAASGQARPHGGGASARKHARAAAAKKRLDRDRRDDDDEDDRRGRGHGAPAQQHNPVYYVLAFVVLGALAAGVAFLHSKSKDVERKLLEEEAARAKSQREAQEARDAAYRAKAAEEDAAAEAAAAARRAQGKPPEAPRRAGAPPAPAGGGVKAATRSDAVVTGSGPVKFSENPPTGGNYGKSQSEILITMKKDRSAIIGELGHLPDTSMDLQGRIDADVAHIANPLAGGEALQAQDRLVKVGRPAIPRVLAVFSRLDFSKYKDMASARDACVVAASVDQILREITGYTTPPRLHFTPDGDIANYPLCAEEWYVWWLTAGYKRETFYKTAPEKETEEKL